MSAMAVSTAATERPKGGIRPPVEQTAIASEEFDYLTIGTKTSIMELEQPPPYGSKQYWEDRYAKTLLSETKPRGEEQSDDAAPVDEENGYGNSPAAFHSWYFSFEELKPIILPLIFGGKSEIHQMLAGGEEEEEDPSDSDDENDATHTTKESTCRDRNDNKLASGKNGGSEEFREGENDDNEDDAQDEGEGGNAQNEEEDGWEEVSASEEDEEQDAPLFKTSGLAKEGPISVLEIGCGDVPLVHGLWQEVEKMRTVTSADAKLIVNRMVCTDYSVTLIDTLKRMHQRKRRNSHLPSPVSDKGKDTVCATGTGKGSAECDAEMGSFPIEYVGKLSSKWAFLAQ